MTVIICANCYVLSPFVLNQPAAHVFTLPKTAFHLSTRTAWLYVTYSNQVAVATQLCAAWPSAADSIVQLV
jgi:hypothetical protein